MLNKINSGIFIISLFILSFVMAEEDYNNIVTEIVTDLLVGVTVNFCISYFFCNILLAFIFVILGLTIIVGICNGEIGRNEIFNFRNARRGLTVGVGREFARRHFSN